MAAILLDTNILFDVLMPRKETPTSVDLYRKFKEIGHSMLVTPIAMATVAYFMEQENYPWDDQLTSFSNLMKDVGIADLAKLDVEKSLLLGIKDIEDAFQYQAARAAGCQYLITRDKRFLAYALENPTILSPEKALALLF